MTHASRRPIVGRSIVATRYGIVAASQPLAARAGTSILERGGNAVDAAITANATIGLMEPTGNGIGGDLFVIFYEAKTGRTYGLNSSGYSSASLTVPYLKSKGHTLMPQRGIHSVTVPGVVAGWETLHQRFGKKPFPDLFAPAVFYAEHGFPVTDVIARIWGGSAELLAEHPNSAATFLLDGRAPKAGELFRNPDLARSLRLIAEQGRRAFYKGEIADAILRISREQGGTLTAVDLAEFEPEWVDPIHTTYRGWTVSEIPPNGIGVAALLMLNIMEQYPLGDWGFHDAQALHVMIEAKKLAFADLIRYAGDPRFSDIPLQHLLSKQHAATRAKLIDVKQAASDVEPSHLEGFTNSKGRDTIYLGVIDAEGNIVSLIQSNYMRFGSGLVPPGTGFMLQNRGALFNLVENHPNRLEPRKRPLHTIIPGFMQKDGICIGFGIMGGFNQPQAHAQFVADIADYGFNLQEALEAGRFTKDTFEGCDVTIEDLVPEDVRLQLESLGHELTVARPRSELFGFGQAVMSDPNGIHFGASDPRHDGAAIPEMPGIE
jgi:gamma-glutamyltranspeptidase / glutathione hydrolase